MAATQHPYVEKLTWDREANAAYLYIRPDGPGKFARTLPVDDKDGATVAVWISPSTAHCSAWNCSMPPPN